MSNPPRTGSEPAPQRVVVTYDPRRRQRRRLAYAVSVLLALAVGFWLGDAQLVQQLREHYRLAEHADALQQQLHAVQGQLAAAELGLQVERTAAETLRHAIIDLQEQVEGLQQEINFYQGLMAPDARQRGLGVRSLEFVPTDNPRVYDYVLVLQQLAGPHTTIQGRAQFAIAGSQAGRPATLDWAGLALPEGPAGQAFRFRYFQKLEGRITLPAGFLPESVLVTARSSGNNAREVEQKFAWRLREGN